MQHRQPGSPDPDESPAYDPSGRLPPTMASDDGGPFGDTRFFDGDGDPGPSEGGAPGARLRAEHGSVDVIEVTLDRPVLDIGRRLTNDIVVHDTNVSRRHARLVRGPDGYAIEDTQSSNGTFVNDERVFGPHQLHHGDVIRIGDAVFVYEAETPSGGPSPTVAPPPWTRSAPDATVMAPAEPLGDASAAEPAPGLADLSHEELAGELARRDPGAFSTGEPDEAGAAGAAEPGVGSSAAGTALADVQRDLATLAETASRLADRVRQLEAALVVEPDGPAEVGRFTADDRIALTEFRRLLADLRAVGDPEAATAAANLLDELSRQPRDVELLLSMSRQAPVMAVVARQHAYLMRLAPLLDEALGRALD